MGCLPSFDSREVDPVNAELQVVRKICRLWNRMRTSATCSSRLITASVLASSSIVIDVLDSLLATSGVTNSGSASVTFFAARFLLVFSCAAFAADFFGMSGTLEACFSRYQKSGMGARFWREKFEFVDGNGCRHPRRPEPSTCERLYSFDLPSLPRYLAHDRQSLRRPRYDRSFWPRPGVSMEWKDKVCMIAVA